MKTICPYLKVKYFISFSAVLFFVVSFQQLTAQSNTIAWNFGSSSASLAPSSGVPVSNLTVSSFGQNNVFGSITPNVNTPTVSSGYTGASGSYYYGHSARSGSSLSLSTTAYYQFTLTPVGGFNVKLNNISFGTKSAANGPTKYELRSSLNNYASAIVTGTGSGTWSLKSNTGLITTSTTGTVITFRIYGYGSGQSFAGGAINWQIDDVIINVTVTNVADYRTKASGNFSSAAIWQFDQGGGTWVNATVPPTNKNNITILHNVALDQNFSVAKNFSIGTNGTLTVNATKTLDVLAGGTANFGGNPVTVKSGTSGSGTIGKIAGTLTGATNVTVERYIPANASRAWRLLAVPTTGAQTIYQAWQENGAPLTSNGFGTQITKPGANPATNGYDASSGSVSILNNYNSLTNIWSNTISNTKTTPIQSAGGYFLYVRGDRSKGTSTPLTDINATTLRTNGTLNQGDITSANIEAGSFAVLGNPYAAAISFDLLTNSVGIDKTFYTWDANKIQGASLGTYQTFTEATGYVPTPGGGSYSGLNTTIESGQAFFVHATGEAGTVTFTESAKVASITNLGMRPVSPSADISKIVKLSTKLFGTGAEILDGNDVVFNSKYENSVTRDDGLKINNSAENFGIIRDEKLLAVEARQPIADDDQVVFNMSNLKQQSYKLQITPQNLNIEGVTATLEDNYKKTSTVINLNTVNEVEFAVDADAASAASGRFKVMFKVVKPVMADVKPGIKVSPNPVEGNSINVQFAGKPQGNYQVRVLNNTGQVLMNKTIQHAGGSFYNHNLSLPAAVSGGAYQLEIVAPDKTRTTQKIVVNK